MTIQLGAALGHDVGEALTSARAYLLGRQNPAGWWKGELRTNVTMDAEDLLLRQFLGILRTEEIEQAARWIRSQQRADGTWANFEGGPADLSAPGGRGHRRARVDGARDDVARHDNVHVCVFEGCDGGARHAPRE